MSPVKNSGNAEPLGKAGFKVTKAEILSLKYNRGSHSVIMNLRYEGCGKVEHILELNGICAQSFPQQCGSQLLIPTSYDESCKSLQNETYTHKLEDNFDGAIVAIEAGSQPFPSVLVDRKGEVSKPND